MFDRSTVACLIASMALVFGIFWLALDSYRNIQEYLTVNAEASYPACLYEDGSHPDQQFPCFWDAKAQGNGLGTSYVLHSPID